MSEAANADLAAAGMPEMDSRAIGRAGQGRHRQGRADTGRAGRTQAGQGKISRTEGAGKKGQS